MVSIISALPTIHSLSTMRFLAIICLSSLTTMTRTVDAYSFSEYYSNNKPSWRNLRIAARTVPQPLAGPESPAVVADESLIMLAARAAAEKHKLGIKPKPRYFDSLGGLAIGKRDSSRETRRSPSNGQTGTGRQTRVRAVGQYFDALSGLSIGKRRATKSESDGKGRQQRRQGQQYFDSISGLSLGKRAFLSYW